MRCYEQEVKSRVEFIQETLAAAKSDGIVFANSGGKDAALVGILCKMACDNTLGVSLPCVVSVNYTSDIDHAILLSNQYNIAHKTISLSSTREALVQLINNASPLSDAAISNIAPRLRMITLYTIASSESRLVAGTSNLSERYTGYFTKWGDAACDFNPIADLTATEVLEFLRHLNAPACIIEKPPSAGLYEGQTDENEMGVTYASLDSFLQAKCITGHIPQDDEAVITRLHNISHHKRKPPAMYGIS